MAYFISVFLFFFFLNMVLVNRMSEVTGSPVVSILSHADHLH